MGVGGLGRPKLGLGGDRGKITEGRPSAVGSGPERFVEEHGQKWGFWGGTKQKQKDLDWQGCVKAKRKIQMEGRKQGWRKRTKEREVGGERLEKIVVGNKEEGHRSFPAPGSEALQGGRKRARGQRGNGKPKKKFIFQGCQNEAMPRAQNRHSKRKLN